LDGELNAKSEDLEEILHVVADLSDSLGSAYSVVERYEIRGSDINQYSGKGLDDPWDCLDDLYWYNYFGRDLIRVLREDHALMFDLPGICQRQLTHGLEVRVNGLPKARPYPTTLQEYLAESKVFRKYNKRPGFRNGRIK
jgi:hypothetical protein